MSNKKMWGIVTNPWRSMAQWYKGYGFWSVTSDPVHAAIHNKNFFLAQILFNGVASGGIVQLAFTTGDLAVHTIPVFAAGADAVAQVYENPQDLVKGTEHSPISHNRVAPLPSPQSSAYEVSSVGSDTGTPLPVSFLPGGEKANFATGSTTVAREELVLAPNTDYLFEVENRGSSAEDILINVGFYETNVYPYTP